MRSACRRWHADQNTANSWEIESVKVVLYLQPLDRHEGCLRIIPSSHRKPFHDDLVPIQQGQTPLSDSGTEAFGMPEAELGWPIEVSL